MAAATARGIPVANLPGSNTQTVVDDAQGMVHAPTGAGPRAQIDFALIDRKKVAVPA